ncbi:MAG: hypothetical protein KGI30_11255, partial [Planctomycetota bacterium]|nr:hypothetical protein [Planctomycetota bacterium]
CALYVLLSNIWPQPDYARFTSTKPAKAGFVPGGHSSPGLKAWGFLADFIKFADLRIDFYMN